MDHAKREILALGAVAPGGSPGASHWQARLGVLLKYPGNRDVEGFIDRVVVAAMEEFAQELRKHELNVVVSSDSAVHRATLQVMHGDEIDFQYVVDGHEYPLPNEALVGGEDPTPEQSGYTRAEVHLREGSQNYDIMGWTQEQVIHDLLEQYEKHLHFLHVLR